MLNVRLLCDSSMSNQQYENSRQGKEIVYFISSSTEAGRTIEGQTDSSEFDSTHSLPGRVNKFRYQGVEVGIGDGEHPPLSAKPAKFAEILFAN